MGAELVDGRSVEVARHEHVRERDREQAAHLLDVGPCRADRRGQERGQPAQALERSALGNGEDGLDRGGRRRRLRLERGEPLGIGGVRAVPVVQVHESQQPVACEQRKPDRRLDLVAPDKRAVDLQWSIHRDQVLPSHGQPHGRAVVMDAQLVGHLALARVAEIAGHLLAHVGQGAEEAFLRLTDGEGGVVRPGRLVVKEDGHDVRAGDVLHVGDHAAKHGGKARRCFDWRTHLVNRSRAARLFGASHHSIGSRASHPACASV